MTILVDTNVLLDVLQNRPEHGAHSVRVWDAVESGRAKGFVAAISYNNVFYILRRHIGSPAALDAVRNVRHIFRTAAFDEALLDRALALAGNDLEDAIQAAAAVAAAADYLVTRNVADFARLGVTAVTPEEFVAVLAAG